MTRVEHWAEKSYHDFLIARKHMPFAWGTNDCALFAADGIQAICGVDIAAEFRDQYETELSAFRAIKSIAGGSTIADAAAYCAEKAGMEELQHPKMAQRGDLVVFDNAGRLISGLVSLTGRHMLAPGDKGLVAYEISTVQRAWRV